MSKLVTILVFHLGVNIHQLVAGKDVFIHEVSLVKFFTFD